MIVYIDSNILFNDPYLSSHRSKAILDNVSVTRGKLKIPFVVYQETINNLINEVSTIEKSLTKNIKDLSKKLDGSHVLKSLHIPSFEEDEIRNIYVQRYEELVGAGLVEIIDHKSMDQSQLVEELLHRALNGIKPFAPKKEEFKDTVIWMTIVNDVEINGYTESIFISNNTSDFYDESKSSLHEHLLSDIPKGTSIKTFMSINDFFTSKEFLSNHSSLNSSIKVTKGVIPRDIKQIASKVDEKYIYDRLKGEYHTEFKTEMMRVFNHIAFNAPERFEAYFPLIEKDAARKRLMVSNSNYFMDEVNVEIDEVISCEVMLEKEFIIVICELNILPSLKIFEDIYPNLLFTESVKLNITMSFSINRNEQFEEFDITSCTPLYTPEYF